MTQSICWRNRENRRRPRWPLALSGRAVGVAAALVVGLPVGGLAAQPADPAPAAMADQSTSPSSLPSERVDRGPKPLPGQLSSRFAINRRNPEENVPSIKERNASPLEFGYYLQDLVTFAEAARKEHDYESWIRYSRAVAKAVPDRAVAWAKLCEAYELTGDTDRAIRSCRYAVDRPGIQLQDYVRYVRLLLKREGALSSDDRAEVEKVLNHLEAQKSTLPAGAESIDVTVAQLRCELGVKAKDVAVLEGCTQVLAKVAPQDPKTVVFQWVLAVQKGQQVEAERLIDRAEKAGIVMSNIQRMRDATDASGGGRSRTVLKLVALVSAILLLANAARLAFRRRNPMSARPAR